jgi:hypothetical protein
MLTDSRGLECFAAEPTKTRQPGLERHLIDLIIRELGQLGFDREVFRDLVVGNPLAKEVGEIWDFGTLLRRKGQPFTSPGNTAR